MIKRYAIVVDTVVVNVAVAESAMTPNWIECDESVSIGDLYVNGEFIKPTTEEE